jgi:hypothetical protein
MSSATLEAPPRVPRSRITPSVQRNAWYAPDAVRLAPTTSPRSLTANASLNPPPSVPRSKRVAAGASWSGDGRWQVAKSKAATGSNVIRCTNGRGLMWRPRGALTIGAAPVGPAGRRGAAWTRRLGAVRSTGGRSAPRGPAGRVRTGGHGADAGPCVPMVPTTGVESAGTAAPGGTPRCAPPPSASDRAQAPGPRCTAAPGAPRPRRTNAPSGTHRRRRKQGTSGTPH